MPEIPLKRDEFALCITIDAFTVSPELRVIFGKEDEACQCPGTELIKQFRIAPIGVHLPVRCDRTLIHDSGVSLRCKFFYDVTHTSEHICGRGR